MQCVSVSTVGGNTTLIMDTPDSSGACPSLVLLGQSDYSSIQMSVVSSSEPITPDQVLFVFSWGFGVVLLFWSLGYAIGAAKLVISKL